MTDSRPLWNRDESESATQEVFAVIRRRKWSLALVLLATIGSAVAVSLSQTPLYESRAEVLVREAALSSSTQLLLPGPNLETEKELAESATVAAIAADKIVGSRERLRAGLSVDVPIGTEILVFNYRHPDPVVAQQRADAFAKSYLEYRREQALDELLAATEPVQQRIQKLNRQLIDVKAQLEATTDDSDTVALQLEASALSSRLAVLQQQLADLTPPENLRVGQVVTPANLPTTPASPNHLVNGALALLAGLTLGVGFAFLRERLDDSLRGRHDLERIVGAPVLASVPHVTGWKRRKRTVLVALGRRTSAAAEAYRTLRAGVLYSAAQDNAKVLMITSPHAGEGKTATVANLGVVLAQAGKNVVLVSADLRKPRLHRYFGDSVQTGLTDVLAGSLSPWQSLRATELEKLQLLSSGPIPGNPAELLGSAAMGHLIASLKERYDFVILDSPPVLAVADTLTLTRLVDGVLLVADAQATRRHAIEQARRELDQVNAPIMGAVLNNFDPSKAGYYGYYGYYGRRYEIPKNAETVIPASEAAGWSRISEGS